MRDDWRFEIDRAFDILPHAAGASWAAVWFRMKGQKNPTSEQFRLKTAEYFRLLEPLFSTYPDSEEFKEISSYIRHRSTEEIEKILAGENDEIEKRYKRYLDYEPHLFKQIIFTKNYSYWKKPCIRIRPKRRQNVAPKL